MRRLQGDGGHDNVFYHSVPTTADSIPHYADIGVQRNGMGGGNPTHTHQPHTSNNHNYYNNNMKQHLLLIVLGMCLGFLLGYDRNITAMGKNQYKPTKHQHGNASSYQLLGTTGFRTDMSPLELLGEFTLAKRALFQKMVQEYGPYASMLMLDQDMLQHLFVISEESRKRFQRRILKKIVVKKLKSSLSSLLLLHATSLDPESLIEATAAPTLDIFTWVTAGDMIAGGFGNRPEETYTAVIEETVRPAFAAVGIDFHARNQAKIGYGSAPELALCMNSLYHSIDASDDVNAKDVDVLSWDFSRTDEHAPFRANFWAAKATLHPSKPLLMMMAPLKSPSWNEFSTFEQRGMGVTLMNSDALHATERLLPDSAQDGSDPQALPRPLQYFICNGATEGSFPCEDVDHSFVCPVDGGDPCRALKFTKWDFCHQYGRYQAPWVPGWKDHHLRGRLLGIFWIHILQDALLQLDALLEAQESSLTDIEKYAKVLQTIEGHERLDNFLLNNYPAPQLSQYDDVIRDFQLLSPTVNRTECFLMSAVPIAPKGLTGESLLSTVKTIREDDCDVVRWGHRESIQVMGTTSTEEATTAETTVEIRATHPPFERLVRIAVCLKLCTMNDVGECVLVSQEALVADMKQPQQVDNDSNHLPRLLNMKVNDVSVTGLRELDSCYFLEGTNNGFHWEMLPTFSSYQLKFQISKGSVLDIFSVITVQ